VCSRVDPGRSAAGYQFSDLGFRGRYGGCRRTHPRTCSAVVPAPSSGTWPCRRLVGDLAICGSGGAPASCTAIRRGSNRYQGGSRRHTRAWAGAGDGAPAGASARLSNLPDFVGRAWVAVLVPQPCSGFACPRRTRSPIMAWQSPRGGSNRCHPKGVSQGEPSIREPHRQWRFLPESALPRNPQPRRQAIRSSLMGVRCSSVRDPLAERVAAATERRLTYTVLRPPLAVIAAYPSSVLSAARLSVPWGVAAGCAFLRGRRELGSARCGRRSLWEAALPETLAAWVWAPVLLPNLGGSGP
jgi:hypothetical protein